MSEETFESWAIVELFGHARIAGKVSEASIGGCSFVRVDVPNDHEEGFKYTRYFGNGAIYALNPVDEKIARVAATSIDAEPVNVYSLQRALAEYEKKEEERQKSLNHFEFEA